VFIWGAGNGRHDTNSAHIVIVIGIKSKVLFIKRKQLHYVGQNIVHNDHRNIV